MNRLKSIVKKYFPLSARSWLIFVAAMASASASFCESLLIQKQKKSLRQAGSMSIQNPAQKMR